MITLQKNLFCFKLFIEQICHITSFCIVLSRAGHKLEAAIEHFRVDVVGKVALDSGLSTGGFTDCLLQYGASFVYGVDVGYGQVWLQNVLKQKFINGNLICFRYKLTKLKLP